MISRFGDIVQVRVCTLAVVAILGAGVACSLHLQESEAKREGPSEWGPVQEGVRTGLFAHDPEFSIGKPILFRLEMENLRRRVVHYDPQQVAVNSSMSIEGTGGVNVPFVGGSVQTVMFGDLPALNPRERTVLFEALDIADQYLLTSPGTYSVRFRGQDNAFGDVAIPASNAITIRVADGQLRPDAQRGRIAEPIGRCPWGEVYLWSGSAPTEELSAVREMISTALKIEGR
jgi:hypothetical protein